MKKKESQRKLDTSLFKEVEENNLTAIGDLIAKGANVNSTVKDPMYVELSILYKALREGNIEAAKILIDSGADLNLHKKLMCHVKSHPLYATLYGKNNVEGLKLLIKSGVDLSSFNDECSPIMSLCSITPVGDETYADIDNKLFEYCKILIKNGATVNYISEDKETPLYKASTRGYIRIARLLLENGAIKNLASCFMFGDYKFISEIEDHSSDINNNIAYLVSAASENNNIKLLQIMKDHGVNLNACFPYKFEIKTALNSMSNKSTTKWLLQNGASLKNNMEAEELCKSVIYSDGTDKLELLLEYGANPNDRWKSNKETALHTALKGSYPYQKAKLLLKYGADITATDQDQLSVMHYIFKNEVGNTSLDIESNMLRLLHKSKNQLSYLRKKGTTLYASESEILRTVILLLKKGADPVAKDSSGNSPLHIAAKGGYGKKIIDKLIEIGNNPDEKNLFGETPAILAAKNFKKQTFKILASSDEEKDIASIVCLSNVDVVKECIDKANTLNIKDHENCTLLHYAVLRKSTSIIKALVSKGVEINSSNKYFETALDLAKIHLKNNIIKYLENKGAKTYQDLISSNQIKRWISQLDRIIANSHLDTNK